jgi:hypothetical protein
MPNEVLAAIALVLAVVITAFFVSVAVGIALGRLGIDEVEEGQLPAAVAPTNPPEMRRDP